MESKYKFVSIASARAEQLQTGAPPRVRAKNRKWISGDEKVKILVAEGLIKAAEPKKEPEPANDAGDEPEGGDEAAAGAQAEAGDEAEPEGG
jgi:hypothetical protein